MKTAKYCAVFITHPGTVSPGKSDTFRSFHILSLLRHILLNCGFPRLLNESLGREIPQLFVSDLHDRVKAGVASLAALLGQMMEREKEQRDFKLLPGEVIMAVAN